MESSAVAVPNLRAVRHPHASVRVAERPGRDVRREAAHVRGGEADGAPGRLDRVDDVRSGCSGGEAAVRLRWVPHAGPKQRRASESGLLLRKPALCASAEPSVWAGGGEWHTKTARLTVRLWALFCTRWSVRDPRGRPPRLGAAAPPPSPPSAPPSPVSAASTHAAPLLIRNPPVGPMPRQPPASPPPVLSLNPSPCRCLKP